jgi:hypothetical protein
MATEEELEGRGRGFDYGRCVRPFDGLRTSKGMIGCLRGVSSKVEGIHLRGKH